VECKALGKSYGEKQVFSNAEFVIEKGDRIALVGHNGAGKSTLIKLLAGLEPVTTGEYRLGHNVDLDYFAQDQYKDLDPAARMLDDIGTVSPRSTQTELRNLLGCFLFSGDDVFKNLGVLSGGERNRYALARMLLQPANFLLLDEPTNHLDLRAKDVLLNALQEFTGTVVFVSHDRYFIDKLATRVFEVGDGKVTVYPGNYEDYLWRKEQGSTLAVEVPAAETNSGPRPRLVAKPEAVALMNGQGTGVGAASSGSDAESKARRLNPIKQRQMQERCREVEEEIARLEAGVATCESELQKFVSAEETKRQTELLKRYREEIDQLMQEWEELSGVLGL